MTLTAGMHFGPYKIAESIGAGGMGEVYRATDTTLERDVAIKVLPASFADDADRVERFEREAKMLAALNHPNIAQIYGLERSDGTTALVMELVDGPTLEDRIAKGPLPADVALGIAKQIADALEAAHSQNIIHRDLKPANIKLKSDGTVKVLDFGIAKAFAPENLASGPQSPIMTTPATQVGVILGTAAYMSPEQAKGKAVDQRTDIWAFGCVLYEMLTGQLAFGAEDVPTTLARVIANDTNLDSLPAAISPAARHTIGLCLRKDVRKRVADIRDVRLALEGEFEAVAEGAVAARPLWKRALPYVAAVVVTGVLVESVNELLRPAPELPTAPLSTGVRRAYHHLGRTRPVSNTALSAHLALSPDGSRIAYAVQMDGPPQLYVRELDQLEARALPDTNGAQYPFFSPDGEWIAFFADDTDQELKRIAFRGGPAQTLATAPGAGGGFWDLDDRIIFSTNPDGVRSLLQIPATGGAPELLLTPDEGMGHQWPAPLPGGDAMLFVIRPGAGPGQGAVRDGRIAVLSLDSGEIKVLIEGAHGARYVPTGHIVFVRSGALWAVPFDVERREITGPEVPIIDGVQQNGGVGGAAFAFSENGLLVYIPGGEGAAGARAARDLVWVDREGHEEALGVEQRPYFTPQVSPDGRSLAVTVDSQESEGDIWIIDLTRGTSSRLTFNPGDDVAPRWTPDSQRVVYWSERANEAGGLFSQAANGTGQAVRLTSSGATQWPHAFTADGSQLVFEEFSNPTDDLYIMSLDGSSEPQALLDSDEYAEMDAAISPDGRWMAYCSTETGRPEIYVRPFPNVDDGRWQISQGDGREPLWGPDGRELYFRSSNQVVAVSIDAEGDSLLVGTPNPLFAGEYRPNMASTPNYDVTDDGLRFVMLKALGADPTESGQTFAIAVENWFDEVRRLAPPAQ